MSIMQEYEEIRKIMGEKKYNAIDEYLEQNPQYDITDIYYSISGYKKFEEWFNKNKECLK